MHTNSGSERSSSRDAAPEEELWQHFRPLGDAGYDRERCVEIGALTREIVELKRQRRAVILAHNYQRPEIFEVADFVGDSLELARKAATVDADVIVFCGVHFMAETAKILNPTKTVLLPNLRAGCSLADSISGEDARGAARELRKVYPDLAVVTYVNTTADVKAESRRLLHVVERGAHRRGAADREHPLRSRREPRRVRAVADRKKQSSRGTATATCTSRSRRSRSAA